MNSHDMLLLVVVIMSFAYICLFLILTDDKK